MKKLFLFFVVACLGFLLTGCGKNEVSSLEITSDSFEYDENFTLSDIKIKAIRKDGTYEIVPLSEDMISNDDLAKFSQLGTHKIKVSYLSNATEFTITITGEKGDDGVDGREVELQVASDNLQWRYKGETTWKNLIALSTLAGATGEKGPTGDTGPAGPQGPIGKDGDSVTFQVTTDFIQWKYSNGTTWYNLIELSSLKGKDGENGLTPVITISEDGYWVINEVKTTYVAVIPQSKNTVTFELNGGVLPAGVSAELKDVLSGTTINLPVPTKEYYVFAGWYTGEDINSGKFTNKDIISKDLTLYAKWDIDYSYLEDFFGIFDTYNYSATIKSINLGEIDTSIYNIQKVGDSILVYEEINGKRIDDDYNEYIEKILSFHFYINDNTVSLYKFITDLNYSIEYKNEGFYNKLRFPYIDLRKFTKRDGLRIYDFESNEEYIIEDLKITVDLDQMKITVYLNDQVENEIIFNNIGSTVVDFPINVFKDSIKRDLDECVISLQMDFATDESIAQFNIRLSEMKTLIDSENDILKLSELRLLFAQELGQYKPIYDDFKQDKFYVLQELTYLIDSYSFPTAESLLNMQAIVDEYSQLIANSSNYFDLYALLQTAKVLLDEEYILDVEASELYNYKNININNLSREYTFGSSYMFDNRLLVDIYIKYNDLIMNAETATEVDNLYILALEEFNNVDDINFDNYFLYNYKNTCLADILGIYEYGRSFYYKEYEEIETYYASVVNEFNSILNPFKLRAMTNNVLINMELLNFKYAKIRAIERIEDSFNYNAPLVADIDLPTITQHFNDAMLLFENAKDIVEINNIDISYRSILHNFPKDPLKLKVYDSVNYLNVNYQSFEKTATDESILEMRTVLDSLITQIQACTTVEAIELIRIEAVSQIRTKYVEDKIKISNLNNIENKENYYFYRYLTLVNVLVDEEDKDLLYKISADLINNSPNSTVEDLDYIINAWYEEVIKHPFKIDYDLLSSTKNQLILDLNNEYDNIKDSLNVYFDFDYYSYEDIFDFEVMFAETINEILYEYNPIILFDRYIYLRDYMISYYKDILIDRIDEEAEYLRTGIYDENLPSFENNIIEFKEYILYYYFPLDLPVDVAELHMKFSEFFSYIIGLDLDYAKVELEDQKNTLREMYQKFALYATDDSKEDLLLAVNNMITLLDTNEVISEEDTIQFYHEFFGRFVKDDNKFNFIVRKEQISNMIFYTLSDINFDVTDSYEFKKIFIETREMVNNATTVTELNDIYYNWKQKISLIEFNLSYPYDYKTYNINKLMEIILNEMNNSEDIETIYDLFDQYKCLIDNSQDYIEVIINFNEGVESLYQLYFQQLALSFDLNNSYYNEIHQIVTDDNLPMVEAYGLYIGVLMSTLHNYDNLEKLRDIYSSMRYLSVDDLKSAKYYAKVDLDNQLGDYKITATDASIILMEAKVVEYKELIDQKTTETEVSTLLTQALDELSLLLEIDSNKKALVDAFYNMKNRVYFICDVYYYNDEFICNFILYTFLRDYELQMKNAVNMSEFDAIYLSWNELMVQQNFVIYEFDKTIFLNNLAYEYSMLTPPISEEFDLAYNNYINLITNSDNTFVIINEYYNCLALFKLV